MDKKINGIQLEICANSLASALIAQEAGASRIELCTNLENGGTTPSYGQIKLVKEKLHIGVNVLIRPRGGDFVYDESEWEAIKEDVLFCKELKCESIVFGALLPDGNVDLEKMEEIISLASPMKVVFHRAFDKCLDAEKALEEVISLGCIRILTSGLADTALEGKNRLQTLQQQSNGRIEIMPGAGVNNENILEILHHTGCTSIHASAKETISSSMTYDQPHVSDMNETTFRTSKKKVEELVHLLKNS
ncbi:copper homeostasis protein CutC [Sphingobacterium hungaricum]|uniref:PF03932 family protein CutC n=1 Tax=Sphingobacterium hungaricum TaxID=2082723 RepID=A0A928YR32_9SPHI|nr:copper homeostasis protein CutC [Sphingobacterium hungaricum]MBE8714569.1 copper homeostasis protein CutC [Sphingobacterium hungaricum]